MAELLALNDAAETMGDVNMDKESSPESGSDSSDSNSDFSSEDGSSDVSDLDKFEEAFQEFGNRRSGPHISGQTTGRSHK